MTTPDRRPIFERHRDGEYPAHLTVYEDGRLLIDGYWGNVPRMLSQEVARLHRIATTPEFSEALGPDLAGRDFAELLEQAATILTERGDGPLCDCLRGKAEQVKAAIAKAEGAEVTP